MGNEVNGSSFLNITGIGLELSCRLQKVMFGEMKHAAYKQLKKEA